MGWHNTGCRTISNFATTPVRITDQEDGRTITVPALTMGFNWGGTIFPWCANAAEVRTKAFLFQSVSVSTGGQMVTGRVYMYQLWPRSHPSGGDRVFSTLFAGGNPSFPGIFAGATISSYVDVEIAADFTVRALAV
jgi:hypothetical protein